MSKQQLQQEIEQLKKQMEEKQKALAATPDKWEPKGGEWWVNYNGSIETAESTQAARNFGVEYATRQQAEEASKAMRAHNRLLNYVAEFAPDYNPDWLDSAEQKAFIIYQPASGGYDVKTSTLPIVGVVFMPYYVANNLAAKLNSGEVEL